MKINKLIIPLFLSINSPAVYANESTSGLIEPIMVTIPAGTFQMGDIDKKDAQPVHKVALPEFSLGKYEVTVREFRHFVKESGYDMPTKCIHQLNGWFNYGATAGTWENNSLNTSDFQPVNCIGWKSANAYVQWLAEKTGRPYRLPSEAEWEYAARAGTNSKYYFGDDPDQTLVCEYENTADLTGENILQRDTNTSYVNFFNGKSNCVDHSAYASIVGMYKPNPFGLHDMISNVVEFTADCYKKNYKNAPTNGQPWTDENCEFRVARGGSWHWNTFAVSERGVMGKDFIGAVEGFRIALDGAAPAMGGNTKQFKKTLKIAQHSEGLRRDAVLPYPDTVTNLTIKQQQGLVTLSWDKSEQTDIESYRVYRNSAIGSTFKLLAPNIVETIFKDANIDNHQYEYTVVAVRRHQQSNYSNTVKTRAPWVQIPGRLEAESASEITGSSVGRTSDIDGKFNLTGQGGISDKAIMSYQLEVAKSGHYSLSYRVAAPDDTKGFAILVNDEELATEKVTSTGGYHQWQTQSGATIYLNKGKNKLTIQSRDKNWKLNWVNFKQN
ncbi:SUMF1/EgtB/PvdO family nonheme iron enzyme [Pseudoalteromonas sp. SR44-5]|uniref:SUMF1/EgtB/PvdO family nonheme iron enzyme n=1 Tax=Pseudoalteromonas sp. SR44-5 TaxID=2760934 RepID=UPI001601B850|nr:SUMF1/EgtB/PvdO family nonheme iron enzyme [Pseudoalteromonas sp. SR44-5]MBB1368952.1 SUMF1/EgtB/PvdO family nonheme iron enzyme [Pseudoalteromonas sp. SR44-5]